MKISRKLRMKLGQTSNFNHRWTWSGTENHQKSHSRKHGSCFSSSETTFFNATSQEYDFSMGSEVHVVEHELCSVHRREYDNHWPTWLLGKYLGLFQRYVSPTFTMSIKGFGSHVEGWYHSGTDLFALSWYLKMLKWPQPLTLLNRFPE